MVSAGARDVGHLEASGHSNLGWASPDLVDGWFGAVPVAQWGLGEIAQWSIHLATIRLASQRLSADCHHSPSAPGRSCDHTLYPE